MAPIRQHHKSRNGCRTCRQRKVKCDEISPVCTNCSRREVECVWNDTAAPSKPPSNSEYLPLIVAAPSSSVDMLTLELMHHFTHYTSLTLQQQPDAVEVWRTVVPSLVFSANASYLLHAMLAVSALHLHSLSSSSKYAYAAASHHAQAMRELPRASDLPPDTPDDTLFLTHSLFSIYGIAASSSLFERNDWLELVRAQPGMVSAKLEAYWNGPVGPLIRASHSIHKHLTDASEEEVEGFPSSLGRIHSGSEDPQAYRNAVTFLKRAYLASLNPEAQTYATTSWLVFAPKAYWELLYERRPRALVIAGHWCAVMRRMAGRGGPWWVKQRRWGEELEGIQKVVGGHDGEWGRWCDWVDGDEGRMIQDREADSDLFSWLTHPAI